MTDFTPAERAALDRATVPAMRPGLTADILAAASGRAPARRGSRGGWRHGRVLIGVGALLAASATAAATGLLDRLPIRIPGITHTVAVPAPVKPKAARLRPRARPVEDVGAVAIAAPLPSPTPTVAPNWQRQQRRRAALIAAGLPPALARRPMIARALAERAGGPRASRGAAIVAEWRRLKALPPADRKAAIVKIRADFLARHPRLAQRYEQRLEARSIAAASDGQAATAAPPVEADGAPRPGARRWRMGERGWRLRGRSAPAPDAPPMP